VGSVIAKTEEHLEGNVVNGRCLFVYL